MNKVLILFHLLCIVQLFGTVSSCTTSSDCNQPYGHCNSGKCFCNYLYGGNNCQDNWRDDKSWSAVFWIYDAFVLGAHSIFVGLFAHQLYVTFRYAEQGEWSEWNSYTVTAICAITGSTARVVLYAIDPASYRQILPKPLTDFLFTIALFIYFNGFLLFLLHLVEIMQQKGINKLSFVHKYRMYFVAYSFSTTVIAVAVIVWRGVDGITEVTDEVHNLVIALSSIVIFVVNIMLAVTVFKLLKQMGQLTKLSGTDTNSFLHRIFHTSLITISSALVLVTLIVYAIVRGDANKWSWIAMDTILRIVEVVILQQFYYVTKKKIPSNQQTIELATTTLSSGTAE